ncbi:MAG: lipoprotein [Burkholderiaceae bacterium]
MFEILASVVGRRTVSTLGASLAVAALCAACGQKGPLVLPAASAAATTEPAASTPAAAARR